MSEEEARIDVLHAQNITGLFSESKFTGDMTAFNALSVRTEVRV